MELTICARRKKVCGWLSNSPHPLEEVYILIPGILDCCLIWQKGLCTCDQLNALDMRKFLGNLSGLIVTTGSFYIEEEGDEDLREEGGGQTQVI